MRAPASECGREKHERAAARPAPAGVGETHPMQRVVVIRSAFLRWRIPIGDIESITPTRNPLSSPALSLDRLEIRHRADSRIIRAPMSILSQLFKTQEEGYRTSIRDLLSTK